MSRLWLVLVAVIFGSAIANLSSGQFEVAFWKFWGAYWLLETRRKEEAN